MIHLLSIILLFNVIGSHKQLVSNYELENIYKHGFINGYETGYKTCTKELNNED